MVILFIILLGRIDANAPTIDTFDMIEVNHKYNEWGGCDLDQVIAWDWHAKDRDFHVQWWRSMRQGRQYTAQGQMEWLKKRRKLADQIKDWPTRRSFLSKTEYRGEFIGGRYMPIKNHRTGYWEIKIEDRIIRSKIFQETHTYDDPESKDRMEYPSFKRRGLTKTRSEKEAEQRRMQERSEFADKMIDFVGPLIENFIPPIDR
jgi:hypothetical protein